MQLFSKLLTRKTGRRSFHHKSETELNDKVAEMNDRGVWKGDWRCLGWFRVSATCLSSIKGRNRNWCGEWIFCGSKGVGSAKCALGNFFGQLNELQQLVELSLNYSNHGNVGWRINVLNQQTKRTKFRTIQQTIKMFKTVNQQEELVKF